MANWLYFHIVSRFGKVVRTVYGGLSIRDLDLAYVRLMSHVCGFPKCSQKEMEKGIEVFDCIGSSPGMVVMVRRMRMRIPVSCTERTPFLPQTPGRMREWEWTAAEVVNDFYRAHLRTAKVTLTDYEEYSSQ